jgi:signal peptidase II
MSKHHTFGIIALILCIDQCTKLYIKTHFELGQEVVVFSWFRILFVENDGMAWGAKLSDFFSVISNSTAKLILTVFRIIALIGIGCWLSKLLRKQAHKFLTLAVAFIFSGGLGNIIDSVFYGVIFDNSLGQKATLFAEQGYANLGYGKVVDMLYFPMFSGIFPDWIPIVGGDFFTFFNPVFNIADVAISIGVGLLLWHNNLSSKSRKSTNQIEKSDAA